MALAVIISGIRYAVMRERLRRADLHAWYQQENSSVFRGQLQDASVQWGYLKDKDAEGITYRLTDDSFVIVLDRNSNTSESKARETLKHESCHIATWDEKADHGPLWQACMTRKTE